MRRIGLAALLAAAAWPCAAAPLAAYGNLPSIEQVAISPSGKLLAIDFTKGEQRTIIIQDIAAKKIVSGIKVGDTKVRGMEWAGDDHLIITSSSTSGMLGVLVARGEWFTAADLNIPRGKLSPLLGDIDYAGNAIDGYPLIRTVNGKPQVFVTGFRFSGEESFSTLFRIDPDNDRSFVIADTGGEGGVDYLVGADGHPAAVTQYDAISKHWTLRVWQGGAWHDAQAKTTSIETPEVRGLGRDGKSIVIGEFDNGEYSLRELSADGTKFSDPLPGPATGDLIDDPATHRLLGISKLDGDALTYTFYDPRDEAQWRAIVAAFSGAAVSLASWSDDRQQIVVHVDSPTDGPGFALVDLKARSTIWLGNEYQGLGETDIMPISYPASDGLTIHGYLTLPRGRDPRKLPLVVLVHGGPAARDEPGFDWWSQGMASAGYAVLRVNYRGSEGYGWKFMAAGFGEWGKKMQTDVSDGVRYLAAQGTVDPARVCIAGASYGGYAAAAGATLDTGVYRCAIDAEGPVELGKFIAWSKSRQGAQGIGTQRYWTRFMGADGLADPHLEAISPADQAAKLTIPFMLIHGKDDTVVPFEQSQMMADALKAAGKPYQFVVLNHEDHWLSHADTRLQLLQATVDFLEKNNPSS